MSDMPSYYSQQYEYNKAFLESLGNNCELIDFRKNDFTKMTEANTVMTDSSKEQIFVFDTKSLRAFFQRAFLLELLDRHHAPKKEHP